MRADLSYGLNVSIGRHLQPWSSSVNRSYREPIVEGARETDRYSRAGVMSDHEGA